MPIADNKRAQTIRNLWSTEVAQLILRANRKVAAIRAAMIEEDLVAEFSVAERDAMLDVETDLALLAATPGVAQAESRYHPTHRGRALIIEGVNDG